MWDLLSVVDVQMILTLLSLKTVHVTFSNIRNLKASNNQ